MESTIETDKIDTFPINCATIWRMDEVLEKARRAKEQAAREAMETQGLVPKSDKLSADKVSSVNGVASDTYSPTDSVNSTKSFFEAEPLDREDDIPIDG